MDWLKLIGILIATIVIIVLFFTFLSTALVIFAIVVGIVILYGIGYFVFKWFF